MKNVEGFSSVGFLSRMPVSLQIQTRRRALSSHADDILRFARRARLAVGIKGTVSILVSSNECMQAMNRHFRHKDKPTDVLSFPASDHVRGLHAGDIAISGDIAVANAHALGHSASSEVKILVLHGMLHLAGFDHETDTGAMATLEHKLRAALRLPGSLAERAAPNAMPTKRALRPKPARMKVSTSRKGTAKGRTATSKR
jgi:probable rRNA maturation factor